MEFLDGCLTFTFRVGRIRPVLCLRSAYSYVLKQRPHSCISPLLTMTTSQHWMCPHAALLSKCLALFAPDYSPGPQRPTLTSHSAFYFVLLGVHLLLSILPLWALGFLYQWYPSCWLMFSLGKWYWWSSLEI